MAVVDSYSPCPCGSGQKFKWCCHKVEAVAERAHRLFEGGQTETAIEALDEGLRKEPGNAWLLTRKAIYLIRSSRPELAREAVRSILIKNPRHAGALILLTRLVLETEGASAGAAQLQQALTTFPAKERSDIAALVKVVGTFLAESGEVPAALAHLNLARSLSAEEDRSIAGTLRALLTTPSISPWQKNQDTLSPPPMDLSGETAERFHQALGWARDGLWSSAAATFETLSSDPKAGPLADRNLGFCRLWLADTVAAVAALRRYAARLGPTTEAVELEALCQQIAPPGSGGSVEQVHLSWPIRNRDLLLAALNADPTVNADEPGPIDPGDEDSPVVEQFELLDRPEIQSISPDLKVTEIPRIVGRVLVGSETVSLESYDDGRLDRLSQRFMTLAGPSIPPAHPKTKTIGKVSRLDLALMWEWLLPAGLDEQQARRLTHEQGAHLLREVWPNTPNPSLRNKTPLEAAAAGDAEVPLRAALVLFEQSRETWRVGFDFIEQRARLGLAPEPAIDPSTVDLATLHLARLVDVPADKLTDEALATLYRRAGGAGLLEAIEHAAKELAARPGALERAGIDSIRIYMDLASIAAANNQNAEATALIERGRLADPPSKRARNAPSWDMFEIRLRTRTEPPETWVPEIAVIIDRYRSDPESSQVVMMSLIDMGLIQMVPNPDRSGDVLLDSRPLQEIMSQYGPRVTTASGRLGVSAAKPEIWTPGGPAGSGSGALYIPGGGGGSGGTSSPPSTQPGGPSKLILPGR